MPKLNDPKRLAALKRERVGVERAGLTDRVAAIDEQIKLYGGKVEKTEKPKGRRASPKRETTAAEADGE